MKKMGKDQIKVLLDLKLGFENQLEELRDINIETVDKKFNKKVVKLRDKIIGNINGYNGLLDGISNEGFDVPGYLYINMGKKIKIEDNEKIDNDINETKPVDNKIDVKPDVKIDVKSKVIGSENSKNIVELQKGVAM